MQLGDAEVDDDRLPVGDHHVARLEVAVYDSGGMNRGQRLSQPVCEPPQGSAGERAATGDHGVQGQPGHVPGHDVRRSTVQVGVQYLGHVAAPYPPHGLDLAAHPPSGVRLLGHPRVQRLERDLFIRRGQRQVHHAHATLADPPD